jgi:hypothetical protein
MSEGGFTAKKLHRETIGAAQSKLQTQDRTLIHKPSSRSRQDSKRRSGPFGGAGDHPIMQ